MAKCLMTEDSEPKLKDEVKSAWLEALRSGQYTQGRGALRADDRYCCLGVLCDVYRKNVGIGQWTFHEKCTNSFIAGQESFFFPPIMVGEWAFGQDEKRLYDTLAVMNDKHEQDFESIAEYIELEL